MLTLGKTKKFMLKKPNFIIISALSVLALLLSSCNAKQLAATPSKIIEIPPTTETTPNNVQNPLSSSLFLETDSVGVPNPGKHVTRYRFVKINFALLLDEANQTSRLKQNSEITLNLFPDLTYTGIIEHIEENGTDYSWSGHLKDVEYSALTMLITGDTFIAHFASPAGVYEVSSAGEDLYQIIMIDQTKLPGGDG